MKRSTQLKRRRVKHIRHDSEDSDYEQERRLYRKHPWDRNYPLTILLIVTVIAVVYIFYSAENSLKVFHEHQQLVFDLLRMQMRSTFEKVHGPELKFDEPELKVDPGSVVNHLIDRVSEFIKLGAQLQYISSVTKVPRDKIVSPGCTSPGEGMVHLVCVHLNKELEQDIRGMFDNFLNVFLSQVKNIPSFVVLEISQKFNEIQWGLLKALASIDFSKEKVNDNDISQIKSIKNSFLKAIDNQMQACRNHIEKISGDRYSKHYKAVLETELQVLITTFHEMTKLSESDLFSKAREGVPFETGMTVFTKILIAIGLAIVTTLVFLFLKKITFMMTVDWIFIGILKLLKVI
ncbi:uncharacterized protein LOC120431936 isoform X2 [Culex pipiens pallens]|nr:uncharacterized protein LOC120431936 isoform X2 [Culex pipiens pallens]